MFVASGNISFKINYYWKHSVEIFTGTLSTVVNGTIAGPSDMYALASKITNYDKPVRLRPVLRPDRRMSVVVDSIRPTCITCPLRKVRLKKIRTEDVKWGKRALGLWKVLLFSKLPKWLFGPRQNGGKIRQPQQLHLITTVSQLKLTKSGYPGSWKFQLRLS